MNELQTHYRLLLGLDANWEVRQVDLTLEARRVELLVEFTGEQLVCPDCGQGCGRHDLAPERTWRHLDTMQKDDPASEYAFATEAIDLYVSVCDALLALRAVDELALTF